MARLSRAAARRGSASSARRKVAARFAIVVLLEPGNAYVVLAICVGQRPARRPAGPAVSISSAPSASAIAAWICVIGSWSSRWLPPRHHRRSRYITGCGSTKLYVVRDGLTRFYCARPLTLSGHSGSVARQEDCRRPHVRFGSVDLDRRGALSCRLYHPSRRCATGGASTRGTTSDFSSLHARPKPRRPARRGRDRRRHRGRRLYTDRGTRAVWHRRGA